jgi:predicted nucleotidyltransferase
MTRTPVRPQLPEHVDEQLDAFVAVAREHLADDLRAVVLFGSAAEGRMRPTSDVNVILVLERFDAQKVDAIRDALRVAHAAIRLSPMFLLASEIDAAAEAFAVKFTDIRNRHVVLYGSDPFSAVDVSRDAALRRVRQVLLNLVLRLRHAYALRSLREEQLAMLVADTAGPLRAAAETVLELEGTQAASPKVALETVVREMGGARETEALAKLSKAREERMLAPGDAAEVLFALIDIAVALRSRAERLE